jgi:hypothetical protein
VKDRVPVSIILLLLLILPLVLTSGCIDINSARRVFFPGDERELKYIQGTIAEVRHNFTGGFGDSVQVLTQEEHFSVDNFYIGEGGGDLFVWGQISFGADTERQVEFQRMIEVSLYYISEEEGPVLRAHKTYVAPDVGTYSTAERIEQIEGAEMGLWSLRVMGNGTASDAADVPFNDWFHVTVNGRYFDDSYNNNAPFSSRR